MDSRIYLVQTDTTAGFLSANPTRLNQIKSRPFNQAVLIESSSLSALKYLVRVPQKYKNRVRRAKKSTFVYPNGKAVRVITKTSPLPLEKYRQGSWLHAHFLKDFIFLYSTSANLTGKGFEKEWAENVSEVIVLDKRGIYEDSPSHLYKLNNSKLQRKR